LASGSHKANAPKVSPRRIMDMACAFYESCVLFAASDLGVFAELAKQGRADAGQVATTLGLDPRGTRLLLDACAALDLVTKQGDVYANSPDASAFLVPGAPGDLSRAIRYNRDVVDAWSKVAEMVRTGKPVERPEVHLGADPSRTRDFVLAMHGRALGIGRAVVPLLELADRRRLLDVGGGSGAYSIQVAETHPQIQCSVLDLPEIADVAETLIEDSRAADRVSCVRGDYHVAAFPEENDVVIIFGVLHQESPEAIHDILRRSFEALVPGGLIYVMDMMTDATRCRPRFSALFAVNMALTAEHGWVFSSDDLRGWMETAGFDGFTCRPLPPPMPHWLASAARPD
jgi:hypothetical protein